MISDTIPSHKSTLYPDFCHFHTLANQWITPPDCSPSHWLFWANQPGSTKISNQIVLHHCPKCPKLVFIGSFLKNCHYEKGCNATPLLHTPYLKRLKWTSYDAVPYPRTEEGKIKTQEVGWTKSFSQWVRAGHWVPMFQL